MGTPEDVRRLSTTMGVDEDTATHALAAAGNDADLAESMLLAAALPDDRARIVHYSEKSATLSESLLSWEDTYMLDTLGFCVLPGAVSAVTLAELSAAVRDSGANDVQAQAALHDVVGPIVEELCGEGCRPDGDTAWRLAGDGVDGQKNAPLVGGNSERPLGRAYINLMKIRRISYQI